jgi:hypothetical protein
MRFVVDVRLRCHYRGRGNHRGPGYDGGILARHDGGPDHDRCHAGNDGCRYHHCARGGDAQVRRVRHADRG